MKTVVLNPEKVIITRNVYCNGYLGGHGVGVFNPNSHADKNDWLDMKVDKSIFVTMGPMSRSRTRHQWASITGRMPASIPCTQEVEAEMQYEGCDAFADFWGFRTDAKQYGPYVPYSTQSEAVDRKHNVICFQEFQQTYDPQTDKYSSVQLNTVTPHTYTQMEGVEGAWLRVRRFCLGLCRSDFCRFPALQRCLSPASSLLQGHWGRYACAPGAGEVTSGTRGRFEIPSYAGFNKMQLA